MCRVLGFSLFLLSLHSGRIQLLRQGHDSGQRKAKKHFIQTIILHASILASCINPVKQNFNLLSPPFMPGVNAKQRT